ncbi:MAG TPA: CHAT domain-containing protein [Candidatus Angelobacter sp.]|nr:CHAT domain-containing protein [Candidatus Angelobacter sp.]
MLAFLLGLGCRSDSWQTRYEEAQQQLRDGDSHAAITLVSGGYAALQRQDRVLAWKLRLLHAQALNRQADKPAESLSLLANAPANLPPDLLADINIAKIYSLCSLHKTAETEVLLEQTDALVGESRKLRAQLTYAKGDCVAHTNANQATAYFQNAAKIAHGSDGYLEARALVYVGYLQMSDRRYDQAIDYFKEALGLTTSPLLNQMALGNLGECHADLGDWTTAISYSQQAETLAAKISDALRDHARWLIDLGREYNSQNQISDAEKSLSNALAIANSTADTDLKFRCLVNLAMLSMKQGDQERAENYIKEADDLHLQGPRELYVLLYKAELLQKQQRNEEAKPLLESILLQRPTGYVKYETETDLATIYVAQKRFSAAEKMFRAGISTVENEFAQIQSDQFRISYLDFNPFYDEYIRFLVDQKRPLDALRIAEHGRSRTLAVDLGLNPGKDLKLPSIQNTLRANKHVVLAYWLGWKPESYLWAITGSEVKLFKLPPEKEIDDAIDAYSQEVLDISSPGESRLGEKLYEMLVAPAEKYIPKGAMVIIIPHRRLYKLNFETLVSPHPKPHFWIDDVCIQNASFLAAIEGHSRKGRTYSKDLLLMGAPVQASKDFPGLAHAPEEIEKVAAHFPRSKETVIDGAAATPDAYESSDPGQYRFLHFVTHGTASDTNPLDSAIILSPSSDGYKLYARDIIKTKIHPELVTISTCYGAGTRQYSGEGLVGLAWAFMRVGAHQVVAALWEVDDAASADLMNHFYGELTQGKSAATALRDGKLAMLHSSGVRRRPFYWASLQLYTGR